MIVRCQYTHPSRGQCQLEQGHQTAHPPDFVNVRPDWGEYHMAAAHLVSTRGNCDRRQVGAVLVRDHRHLATGYNGAPSGSPTCEQEGHQLVTFEDGSNSCVRTIHAEVNALTQCAKYGIATRGSTMYVTAGPCLGCLNACIACGVVKIVFATPVAKHWGRGVDLADLALRAGVAWVGPK